MVVFCHKMKVYSELLVKYLV